MSSARITVGSRVISSIGVAPPLFVAGTITCVGSLTQKSSRTADPRSLQTLKGAGGERHGEIANVLGPRIRQAVEFFPIAGKQRARCFFEADAIAGHDGYEAISGILRGADAV